MKRQRILSRLFALTDHAHQRSYAARQIMELMGLDRQGAVEMVEAYRGGYAQGWLRHELKEAEKKRRPRRAADWARAGLCLVPAA